MRRGLSEERRFFGFYGWPEVHNKHLSWSLMESLAVQSSLPWLCMGDFNGILFFF